GAVLSKAGTATGEGARIERAEPGEVRVRRALLSVSDKRGVVDFARGLEELGVEVMSTGGTARELLGAGIAARAIEDFSGFPEIMDGRVKTLVPRLYAALLARRDEDAHLQDAADQGVEQVDLVCVNLYPFEQTVARGEASEEEIGENPHQRAAFYARVGSPTHLLDGVNQLHGKELSFNNLLDLNSARQLAEAFEAPACAIVKHNNPCGCATSTDVRDAYERAFACDPQSAYGGVIAPNRA